jgi:8-amino-3,8-dideoxy-alpha-D-manno-octulosonate transaminase
MDRIMDIAGQRKIRVLEDCAQCNGGSFGDRKVGTFGAIGMYSLQINKNVTAGEGGVLITSDEELYWRLNAIHDLGVPWKDAEPALQAPAVGWGQGRRMAELCGAVARVQLGKLPDIVAHMRASKYRIREAVSTKTDVEFRRITDESGDTGSFLIAILPDADRAKAAAEAAADAGMASVFRVADYGLHVYYNIPQLVGRVPLSPAGNPWSLPQNQGLIRDYAKGACPRSDGLFERSVIVAVPSRLSAAQEKEAVEILTRAFSC